MLPFLHIEQLNLKIFNWLYLDTMLVWSTVVKFSKFIKNRKKLEKLIKRFHSRK